MDTHLVARVVAGVYTTRCRCLNDLGFQSLISKVARVPLRWGSGACGVTRWRRWAGMFPSACDRGLGACCLFGACYLWWRMTWCDGSGACLCPNDAFPAPRYLTPPGSLPGGGGACMGRQLPVGRGDGCAHFGHLLWRTGAWIWCHLCGNALVAQSAGAWPAVQAAGGKLASGVAPRSAA